MIRFIVLCFAILSLLLSVLGEIMPISTCDKNLCEIKDLKISPCPQAPNKACKFAQGSYATIDLTFVANFNANKLNATASTYKVSHLELESMDHEACKYTKCPLVSGTQQTYKYDLLIESYFPRGPYRVRYDLFNAENKDEMCCVYFDIKITK